MISEPDLMRLLIAKIECDPSLWSIRETLKHGMKRMMPVFMRLLRDEINEAKREWTAKERQE